ncbi:MAG TPA: hypothetical protein VF458_07445 [Ktedonobacteraceae bacterium]
MGQWFQRLLANAKYGAVNDAAIQGYLRAASQIENVWQQIDDKVNEFLLQGLPPWEAYSRMGYALAFVRACRLNVVFVQELLKAETASDQASAGYLPRVTYEQALALCEQIEPTIEEAIKASTNSRYILPRSTLPLKLGPHIASGIQNLPLSHLQGMMRAAQEIQGWTAGLLAQYELALHAPKTSLPAEVSAHLEQMKSEVELGNFHLRTGTDMVGQVSQGKVAEALHPKAEGFLWEAMESFYQVSQLLAMPDLRPRPAQRKASTPTQQPAPTRQEAAPQAHPLQRLPDPPEPVALDLLNQVTAEPGPAQSAPAQTAPDLLDMLKQVTANPQPRPPTVPQQASETHGLLNQGRECPRTPDVSQTDLTGLLAEEPGPGAQPPAQSSYKSSRQKPPARAEQTSDLLANICGEQEQTEN